jgi:hypothetical protein
MMCHLQFLIALAMAAPPLEAAADGETMVVDMMAKIEAATGAYDNQPKSGRNSGQGGNNGGSRGSGKDSSRGGSTDVGANSFGSNKGRQHQGQTTINHKVAEMGVMVAAMVAAMTVATAAAVTVAMAAAQIKAAVAAAMVV